MSSITIEGTPVEVVADADGFPISISGHLLLIFNSGGAEWVIRGGPTQRPAPGDNSYGPILYEAGVPILMSVDTRANTDGPIPTPESRGSVTIDFGERDPAKVWDILVRHVGNLATQGFSYDPYGFNSNTTAANLLAVVGINVHDYLPDPAGIMVTGVFGTVFYDSWNFPGTSSEFAFDFTLAGTDDGDLLAGSAGDQQFYGLEGDDTIWGAADNDALFGGSGGDELSVATDNPSEESDAVYGGTGDDRIYFDVLDTVDAGSGFDLGIVWNYNGGHPFNGDISDLNLEALLATQENDVMAVAGDEVVILAGAGGNDTFVIDAAGSAPTIVWGGDGADIISIARPIAPEGHLDPAGILIVNVAGLTQENFHLIDIESLGLSANFDWTKIDAVIINPDASDKIELRGGVGGSFINVERVTTSIVRYINVHDHAPIIQTYGTVSEVSYNSLVEYEDKAYPIRGVVDTYQQDFLDGYSGTVFAPWDNITTRTVIESKDSDGRTSIPGAIADSVLYDYDSGAIFKSSWYTGDGSYGSRELYFRYEATGPVHNPNGWFLIGGTINGTVIASTGAISYTMPGPEELSGTGGSSPRGGSYGSSGESSNNKSGDGNTRYTKFDSHNDSVVINGNAITANHLINNVTAHEYNGSTVIHYGADDNIILRGVTLAQWQASAAQTVGSSASEVINGTASANVIASGGGNDTLAAGAGDDRINYTSGNDLILGNTSINYGNDTLDFRRYKMADVHFTVSGHDVQVTTPDGTVTLQYQVRYEYGNARSNIESILFSDGTLNEAGIKERALADQATAGHDLITGTIQADVLFGLAGNDTLAAAGGNDTLYFNSGQDVILGATTFNTGQDTLDLSQYSAASVKFKVIGHDVVVTTPDGTIRLEYQVRYAFGHERSNIEQIIFSDGTLNEAGIKGRALADQGTVGNDVITGTSLNDVLNGQAGNDTITGGAGSDVFVFGVGAGKDRITDFSLTADHIRFSGHVFSDLSITQSGANALVAFGVNDVMTLVGITASNLTSAQFEFL